MTKNSPSATVKFEVAHGDELAEGLVEILDADLGHRAQSTKWLTMTNIAVPKRMVAKDQP